MGAKYKRIKLACYSINLSMSVICNLPPLLFLTFRSMYGISYTLLGLLVLINFVTQLGIDLIFSFFSHKFNIPAVVKLTPAITLLGLAIYALWPYFLPESAYLGMVIGTIVFSTSGGLSEVLISPVIAAIPAKDPDREMSKLHSIFAWGIVGMIAISTLFFKLFGAENWTWLMLLFTLVPIFALCLFAGSEIPAIGTPERTSGALKLFRNKGLWLCIIALFLGGASESTMSQWCSGYLESALDIPKVWGDLCGVALYALMLGMGRTLYSKYGKNIGRVLFLGAIGASVCYLTAAVSTLPVLGLLACAFTGLCVSMLWPGCLIVASDRFPAGGVFVFAVMAAGGDLGASAGPQLIGIVADAVIASPSLSACAQSLALTPDQFGMKLGMLVGMLFSLAAIPLYLRIMKTDQRKKIT